MIGATDTSRPVSFPPDALLVGRPGRAALWTAAACLSLLAAATSASQLRLAVAELETEEWSVNGLAVALDADRGTLLVQVERLSHPALREPLRDIELACASVTFDAGAYSCESAVLTVDHAWIRAHQSDVVLKGDLASGNLDMEISGLRVFKGDASVTLSSRSGSWRAHGGVANLDLPTLLRALALKGGAVSKLQGAGRLDLSFDLDGGADRGAGGTSTLTVRGVALDSADGRLGLASLRGAVSMDWRDEGRAVTFKTDAVLNSGGVFVDPIYVEATDTRPIALSAHGAWSPNSLLLRNIGLRQAGVGELFGELSLELPGGGVDRGRLSLRRGELTSLYSSFIQSFLDPQDTLGLSVSGELEGDLTLVAGQATSIAGHLRDGSVTDGEGNLDVQGMWAEVEWSADESSKPGRFGWDAAALYRIPMGPMTVQGQTTLDGFRLTNPTRIPVLGGEVVLESMLLKGGESVSWHLGSRISGVSLTSVSEALGWPAMGGDVTATAPNVEYADDVLTVGGAVLMRVFSGTATVTGLRLERPLGPVPTLRADVLLRNLDLHELTSTFSVGNIEGRIDGQIQDIELIGWVPTRFDLFLSTPDGFEGRRRISQNAVRELTEVSGGPAAGLSQGMLGIFDEFPYRRLGIGCKLAGGVCTMRGVAPAKQGYYLVEGRGLPRIDVIGFVDQVNWAALVDRLAAAARGGPPVVQ